MNDILSGGVVDESTSGPIPSNMDDRRRDIISEQEENQLKNSVGGSQNPPRVEPLPPIPEPPQVAAPPLPSFSLYDSSPSFGAEDMAREIARQAIVDVLKNVTIDGVSPTVEGGSISFNTEKRSTASEDFGTGGDPNFLQPRYNSLSDYPVFNNVQNIAVPAPTGGSNVQPAPAQGVSANDKKEESATPEYGAISDHDSASAYKAAQDRKEEREKNNPNFDKTSTIRQEGETPTEYKERMDDYDVLVKEVNGPIAVELTRADGEGKVFAFFKTESSTLGEPTLPKDQYYVGGGLPEAENNGDIIYWDKQGETPQWKSLTAPENATIEFKEFDICENGQSKKYNFVVWKTESTT